MRKPTSLGTMALMAAMVGMAASPQPLFQPFLAPGRAPQRYARPKNQDNSKNRAPGMKEFWVRDGVVVWRPGDPPESPDGAMLIWAGTEKAALKKYRLLVNSHLSNGQ